MAVLMTDVSFKTLNFQVLFFLHVNNRGFAIVPEQLLCVRFHLQEATLLIEREEFDEDGNLCRIVYQKPYVSDWTSNYKVWLGSYMVVGGVFAFDISSASTISPGSVSSFKQRTRGCMMPSLPSVSKVSKYTILSSSDKEDA